MSTEPDLVDRGVHNFESELEILVELYRVGPIGLPPQRLAEVFGRYFALECLRAYGMNGFLYASQGFVATLEALREMPKN